MTGPNERDEIAAVLLAASEPERALMARPAPDERVAHFYGYLADAILASDWLAERDRRTAATALREAADELAPRASSKEPCDNADACCGSADSCDAIRPMRRLVGESWLRDRADRIERGE